MCIRSGVRLIFHSQTYVSFLLTTKLYYKCNYILPHKRQTTKDEIDNLQTCFFIMVFYVILMVIYRSLLFIVLSYLWVWCWITHQGYEGVGLVSFTFFFSSVSHTTMGKYKFFLLFDFWGFFSL